MAVRELLIQQFSRSVIVSMLGQGQPAKQQKPAVEYLVEYLAELKAEAVLHEPHYVDRHFLDDFAAYYARSFSTPAAHCERLHFWKLSPGRVTTLFQVSFRGEKERADAERELEEHYLGFVVRRPLVAASIGRTVLKTYPPDGRRHYEVVRPYRVNIAGLRLKIDGLAYQQQDRGAAVCASTALWSALQRVASVSGHRTPTPIAITKAAQSPFPASAGLESSQMAAALSSLGYIADRFAPEENRALFRAMLVAALESQLPVILGMTRKVETAAGHKITGHAVTATGFAEPLAVVDVPAPYKGVPAVRMRGGALDTIYVHDDNLGSHAHYELFDSDEEDEAGHKKLMLRRGRSSKPAVPWWTVDEWVVVEALVPKPDKLRLPLQSLFLSIVFLRPLLSKVFPGLDLHYASRFASGVEYRRKLLTSGVDGSELRAFQFRLDLPRHIGVVTVLFNDAPLCEFVLDVTEIERNPESPSVVALVAPGVPKNSAAWLQIKNVAKYLDVPLIAAPIMPGA